METLSFEISIGGGRLLPTLIYWFYQKLSLKLISSPRSSFWLTTYLLCLVNVSSNGQSACIWVQTVLLFSPICSFLFVWGRLHTGASQEKPKEVNRSVNSTFRYIDDILSLNNSSFDDFVDRIYPIELEINDTTDTDRFASYLDLHIEIDNEGRLRTKLYDNCELFIYM